MREKKTDKEGKKKRERVRRKRNDLGYRWIDRQRERERDKGWKRKG